jgi:hypothetical protein
VTRGRHDAPVIARIIAICGWLAWQLERLVRALRLGRIANRVVTGLGVALLVVAAIPIVVPLLDAQPEDVTVQEIFDETTEHPDGWIRLRGRLVPLADSPTGERGSFAVLVDADNPLRAVAVETPGPVEAQDYTLVTGTLASHGVALDEPLPLEATVAGTQPQVASTWVVRLDAVPKPERSIAWFLAIPPALLGTMLLAGARAGYPIFRPTSEIAVLTSPLAPGERVPSAYGGRIGTNERPLIDPGGALLLVRRGPNGSLLTAQPLPDDGSVAPQPVLIGGSWTSGRVGAVHTLTETIPALLVRSELVDATFLFARNSERDRVAALVALER